MKDLGRNKGPKMECKVTYQEPITSQKPQKKGAGPGPGGPQPGGPGGPPGPPGPPGPIAKLCFLYK